MEDREDDHRENEASEAGAGGDYDQEREEAQPPQDIDEAEGGGESGGAARREEEDTMRKRSREADDEDVLPRKRKSGGSEVGRQVYVGNLDFRTSKQFIEDEFSKFGPVEDVYLPLDDRRQPRGFCFVTFAAATEAEAACDALNDREFDGRVIRVNIARPRPPPSRPNRRDGHRGPDDGYRGRDDGHRGHEDGYRGRDDGHRSRDDGHRARDDGYRGRDDHRRDDRSRGQHPGRIHVSGLPDDINEREIDDLYYKYGRIEFIETRRNSRSGRVEGIVA